MTYPNIEWSPIPLKNTLGVIVGCTQDYEWLLPWWWMNFRLHNSYPVTFVNFGNMSSKGLNWCEKRGQIITLEIPDNFVKTKEEITPKLIKIWDPHDNPSLWSKRPFFYKKPFALLRTPYDKTVWLDLDCQVRCSLVPFYKNYLGKGEIAMVAEAEFEQRSNIRHGQLLEGETMYNTGIVAYKHGCVLIEEWARQSVEQNHLFYADQQLLAHIIAQKSFPIVSMPLYYNLPARYGVHGYAQIIHWWGPSKDLILEKIADLQKNSCIDLFIN
jgi:hypothetical protein